MLFITKSISMRSKFYILLAIATLLLSCSTLERTAKSSTGLIINSLTLRNEVIIPNDATYEDTAIGGLSGIDYVGDNWYIISDDRKNPRFYIADIDITGGKLQSPIIKKVITLKDTTRAVFTNSQADPESIRITNSNKIIWSSEGNISKNINPFIRIASLEGDPIKSIEIPSRYCAQNGKLMGPRNNGVFEALTRDYDSNGYWVSTELPLQEDGKEPTFTQANSPIRIAFIDGDTYRFGASYAYMLDRVARKGKLEVNGVTEILSYNKDSFLVLERSYSSGHTDGGNDIKIYKVTTTNATDVSTISSLSNSDYVPVTKTLLLDFGTLRSELVGGIVDNIEGMTFGPDLKNGNKSLVVVSDNNFNSFGKQITQLILLEIK